MPFRDFNDIRNWITAAESNLEKREPQNKKNRKYYEAKQKPADIPKNIAYIVKNKCRDFADRRVSKVVGSEQKVMLKGLGKQREAVELLLDNIAEKNMFRERLIEKHANFFEVEGTTGWKFVYNPMRLGPYGLGFPEWYTLKPSEILLDPNSMEGDHSDDLARAHKKRVLLREMQEKYPDFDLSASGSERQDETEEFCELYEVEFRVTFYIPAYLHPDLQGVTELVRFDDSQYRSSAVNSGAVVPASQKEDGALMRDSAKFPTANDYKVDETGLAKAQQMGFDSDMENTLKVEQEVFFVCKVINNLHLVEAPQPTKHAGFTIISNINIPQMAEETGTNYGKSLLDDLIDTQDRINSTRSVVFQVSKKSLKNPRFHYGVTDKELTEAKRKAAAAGEDVAFRNPNARMYQPRPDEIPPHLLQDLQLDEQAFDDIGSTHDADVGGGPDVQGASGIKVARLAARSDLPMYVPKVHYEQALVELYRRTLECIKHKMNQPFSITADVDGEEKQVYFNGDESTFEELRFRNDTKNQIIFGDLSAMTIPDVGIDIVLNALEREQIEISKALQMSQLGKLGDVDLHKALYPNRWQETYENYKNQDLATQLVQNLAQNPAMMQGVMQMMQMAQQSAERLQAAREEDEQMMNRLGQAQPANGAANGNYNQN